MCDYAKWYRIFLLLTKDGFLRNGCIAAFMQNINISYNNKVRRYNPNFTIFNNYMKTDRLLAFL